MKLFVNISRVVVGALFIFSGLVKAIDPLGLAYKMQEFFEVWAADGYFKNLMNWLNNYAIGFSIFMITLEVVLGVALLIGWQKKLTIWLLFVLTLFFTFLTAFVLFSGKIRACGCFGDCIPLTPIQTFTKDIILTVLIIVILIGQKYIQPLVKKMVGGIIILIALIAVLSLQFYVLNHLPIKDCLPYKIGNNILELRKTPADATYDKFFYSYFYKKGAEEKEFGMDKLPDSTWKFVKQANKKLLEKGNGKVALINDFSFTTESGADTTEAILNQPGEYYLLFAKDFNTNKDKWYSDFKTFYANKVPTVYLVTSDVKTANEIFNIPGDFKLQIFSCDATAIKTAARVNPTLFLMKGPVIQNKWSFTDAKKIVRNVKDSAIKSL
ncbi:BT_3928 family protein [Ferruginibacter sp.]